MARRTRELYEGTKLVGKGTQYQFSTVLQGFIWGLSPCIVIRLDFWRGRMLGLEGKPLFTGCNGQNAGSTIFRAKVVLPAASLPVMK